MENDFDNEEHSKKDDLTESAKRMLEKSKSAIKQVSEQISHSAEDPATTPWYAALAYFPILGPVISLILKRGEPFVKQHALNASFLQTGFAIIWLAVWLLENLPLISGILKLIRFVPYMTNAFMYLDVMFLLALSSYGVIEAIGGREFKAPIVYDLGEKFLKLSDNHES
ncbi:MAG: hypothetical protein D6767_04185 [Candidatus Hydrogenedentota bacterium]|nr:MAG: hypothetical protein D6767_04185 [Candidatus Hydrogenedentota bacterium]